MSADRERSNMMVSDEIEALGRYHTASGGSAHTVRRQAGRGSSWRWVGRDYAELGIVQRAGGCNTAKLSGDGAGLPSERASPEKIAGARG